MLNVLLTWIALGAAGVPSPAGRITYTIEPARSRVTVETRTEGTSSPYRHDHRLDAEGVSGLISFIPDAPDTATLELKIRADQLRLTDPGVGDKDRRAIDAWIRRALGAETHREIAFRSTAVTASPLGDGMFDVAVTGDLRIRGRTRPVTVEGQLFVRADGLAAEGSAKILQSQFEVPLASLDGNTTTVRDEVVLTFQLHATPRD